MNYLPELRDILAAAIVAEALVEAFKFPVALIKRITNLQRVKPFDCGLCMAFWVGLQWDGSLLHGFDIYFIAFTVLARQIMYRLRLW